jgi:glutaredoxin 3
MYSTMWCGYCSRARRLLQSKGADLEEIDVDSQPNGRAEMVARSKRHTVPQIFIGERHVGGSDELLELEAAGQLDSLLNGG